MAQLDRALEIDLQFEPAMSNRLVVDGMEEGFPLSAAGLLRIELGKMKLAAIRNPRTCLALA